MASTPIPAVVAGTVSPVVEEVEEVPARRAAPDRRRGRSQVRADHALTLAALDQAGAEVDAARGFVQEASYNTRPPSPRTRAAREAARQYREQYARATPAQQFAWKTSGYTE